MSALETTELRIGGTRVCGQGIHVVASEDPPSLRANFAWTLGGNVIYAGCQWGMLSALAKLSNPSVIGQFTLGLAISAPIFILSNLQLRAIQSTDVRGGSEFFNYFTHRLIFSALGLALIVCLLPFVATSSGIGSIVFLVSLAKCLECMSDVTAGLLQREEQLKRVALSLMIRGVLSLVVFVFSFAQLKSLSLSIVGMCVVWAVVLVFYDLPNVRKFGHFDGPLIRFNRDELFRLTLLGLPLGWVATFSTLTTNIPRYFLQHHLGLADQGLFASLAYLVVSINLVVFALTQAVTTRLARLFAEGHHREFNHLLAKLSAFGVLMVVMGAPISLAVGRKVLAFVYRPEYAEHAGLLALLVAVSGINAIGSFLFCGLTAARVFRQQLPIYAASVVVVLVASEILVPRYRLVGGVLALMLSAGTIVLGGLWQVCAVLRKCEMA